MMVSSWSRPQLLAPFFLRTPNTWNGRFLTRIVWPTGSPPPKSSSTTVWPTTATRAAVFT